MVIVAKEERLTIIYDLCPCPCISNIRTWRWAISLLLWHVTQRGCRGSYRRFTTICWSHFRGSSCL